MADFPEDLDYGIKLDQPAPNVGTGYNPPQHSIEKNQSSVTDQQQQAAQNNGKYDLKRAAHPAACVATFAFKAAAIFSYLIIGSIIDSSIITFILVIMFSSLDFWVVKNITGRLLVGLRWWSEVDKNGKESWRFQNPDDSINTNMVDSAFFWTSQVIGTAVWGLFFILKVLTLSVFWSLLLFVCCSLCGTNLYAYYQCRGDHQKKLGDIKKMGVRKIMENAF